MLSSDYTYLLAITIVTIVVAVVGKCLFCRAMRLRSGFGPRPMTWMEEHMLQCDCFPKEANLPPTCNVINCAVLFKDSMPSRGAIEKVVEEKLLPFTRFSSVPDVETHSWKPVDNIDLSDHIFISEPMESRVALDDKIQEIINHPLPTDRPLWRIHLLPAAKDAVGVKDCMFFRSHHTIGDGFSLVQVLEKTATNLDGSAITFTNPKEKKPMKLNPLAKPIYAVLYSLEWLRSALAFALQNTKCFESEYGFNSSLAHRKGGLRYSGHRKSICFEPFSLNYVKAIKNNSPKKATVNDVLLGAMVGAMKRYGGDAVDDKTIMRMLIPVAAPLEFGANPPAEGDRLGNNWSFCSVDLSSAIKSKDSVSRLLATGASMNRIKRSLLSPASMFITNKVMPLVPSFFAKNSSRDLFARNSVVFSNVPGAQQPCCFAGKEVDQIYPIFPNLIDQVIVLSYNGKLMLNMVVDPDVVKDYDKLEGYYREELLDMGQRLGVRDVQL
ncbi:hypothetical protein FOZ61_010181 [Perkinsus olseni]|uniref:Diacylglycerol O-acyltransferase n=1 Tax=Perkinsus olseni TaxID=32597 RepID=A0A7J6MHW5_PEROL|nr:hypothetical protein FOZ61_010181 [Perkinsus olseni]